MTRDVQTGVTPGAQEEPCPAVDCKGSLLPERVGKAEDALRGSEARYRTLITLAEQGVGQIDAVICFQCIDNMHEVTRRVADLNANTVQ